MKEDETTKYNKNVYIDIYNLLIVIMCNVDLKILPKGKQFILTLIEDISCVLENCPFEDFFAK